MYYQNQDQMKHFNETINFIAYYPDHYSTRMIFPEIPAITTCPNMDIGILKDHQDIFESYVIQGIDGKNNMARQAWVIDFHPEDLHRLGECTHSELTKISEYCLDFFADKYQMIYRIQFAENRVSLLFSMNPINPHTSIVYSESLAGRFQEYFAYLCEFFWREYGLAIEIVED